MVNDIYRLCDRCNPNFHWFNAGLDTEQRNVKRKLCVNCNEEKPKEPEKEITYEELKRTAHYAGWVH